MEPTKETPEEKTPPMTPRKFLCEKHPVAYGVMPDFKITEQLMVEYAKHYHAVMLKQEMPSEEEALQMADKSLTDFRDKYNNFTVQLKNEDEQRTFNTGWFKGFKAAIELLTKGKE